MKRVSGTNIEDAPSGFRAFHRDAATRLYVFGHLYARNDHPSWPQNIPIVWVPVKVNRDLRPSRLVTSIPHYIWQSIITIGQIYVIYKPLRFFIFVACLLALPGLFFALRFLVLYAMGQGIGHVQSLVLSGTLLALSGIVAVGGILAELIAANRILLEHVRTRMLRAEAEAAQGRPAESVPHDVKGRQQIGWRTHANPKGQA